MPYTPVGFVDGSTALNAANLNQLEDGVEAAERTENKGQPGGYPALDATGKVPSAQLPATGGAAALGEYQFSTTASEPPASGRIRMNNADQTLATLLWISDTNSGAVAVGNLLDTIKIGEAIYIQDKNDAGIYRLYDVTALPVAKSGYHEVAVTFNKGAGAALANNETLLCSIHRLAGGGADLDYEGDYVAATEYQDGDVVVKDGVAYLCVGGPTTTPPDPAPWGAAALAKVAYGTSLPASPVDGQEAILVDSLTNSSYQWRFRYNAGSSSAYKWEFVGGAPAIMASAPAVGAPFTATTTTPVDLAGGPTFAAPRAGDYTVDWKMQAQNNAVPTSPVAYRGALNIGGVNGVASEHVVESSSNPYGGGTIGTVELRSGVAAAAVMKFQVWASAALGGIWWGANAAITPRRVS